MRDLFILTTATPRFDLQEKCLFTVIDFLINYNATSKHMLFENVFACINIDKTDFVSKDEMKKYEKDLFDRLIASKSQVLNFDFTINLSERNDFGLASATVHKLASKYRPSLNSIFMWLEDDWEVSLDKKAYIFDSLKSFINNHESTFLNFINNDTRLSGRPFFFKYEFYIDLLHHIICEDIDSKMTGNLDPEIRYFDLFNNLSTILDNHYPVKITTCDDDCFIDRGREWRENLKLDKWCHKRNDVGRFTWTKRK